MTKKVKNFYVNSYFQLFFIYFVKPTDFEGRLGLVKQLSSENFELTKVVNSR